MDTGARPPSGPCNYTNLNIGGGARCGCRRFTDHSHGFELTNSQPGFCVCAHHSCYHDLQGDGAIPVVDVQLVEGPFLAPKPATPTRSHPDGGQPDVGPLHMDSLPDTLQWSRFIHYGDSQGSLPAIPSECLLPSDHGSGTSSSQAGHSRPFAGLGLHTLSHVRRKKSTSRDGLTTGASRLVDKNGKPMQKYQDSDGHGHLQSLTEVATPSMKSSQDPDTDAAFIKNSSIVQGALQKLADDRTNGATMPLRPPPEEVMAGSNSVGILNNVNNENLLPRIMEIVNHVAEYPLKIQDHEHRLDLLENASFSQQLFEEVRDRHELLESLVSELDERVAEVEKQQQALNDASSVGSRQLNSSIDSRVSATSSALVARAIGPFDYSRIEALEAQISELQTISPPSYSRPWEVEAVFLPFGPRLMGVWSTQPSVSQGAKMSMLADDNWMQTQYDSVATSEVNLTTNNQPSTWEFSVADGDQRSWLVPKACGLHSKVDNRLRSRGLVKMIQVQGPDARDVQAAILTAFGKLLDVIAEDPYSSHDHKSAVTSSSSNYLGLRSSWVPLRKVHKDSNLRFLNASEMVTPALWTAQFLSASVAMRATGIRRLYITQSDSYIQQIGTSVNWTWQKLRRLGRVYPDSGYDHTPEADAHEPCWEFDARLDPPPSVHSSIESHLSLTIRPVSHTKVEPVSTSDSSSPRSRNASIPPTSLPTRHSHRPSPFRERPPFRHIHARTVSMPSLIPASSQPKRRIASFDHEPQSSPLRPRTLKRVRTRSPSRPRDTPRWSIGPPSPYTYAEEFADIKRGTTPFAYATPYSNAPYIERHINGDFDDDDGDDEKGSTTDAFSGGEGNALSDYDYDSNFDASEAQRQPPEDEWEGVQDQSELLERESRPADRLFDGSQHPDEEGSEAESSSCPSEYPSHQPAGQVSGDTKAGFRIHVDEEVEYV